MWSGWGSAGLFSALFWGQSRVRSRSRFSGSLGGFLDGRRSVAAEPHGTPCSPAASCKILMNRAQSGFTLVWQVLILRMYLKSRSGLWSVLRPAVGHRAWLRPRCAADRGENRKGLALGRHRRRLRGHPAAITDLSTPRRDVASAARPGQRDPRLRRRPKCRRARVSSFGATRCPGTWPARGCTCSRRRTRARWYPRPTATRRPGAGSEPSRISSDGYRSTRVTRWWSPPSSADWRLQHMYRS